MATTTMMPMVIAVPLVLLALTVSVMTRRETMSSFSSGSGMVSGLSNVGATDQAPRRDGKDGDAQAAQCGGDVEGRAEAPALADRSRRGGADSDARVERPDHAAERPRAIRRIAVR